MSEITLLDAVSEIIDNRGRTCPTSDHGIALIATNCVKNEELYPVFEKVRYLTQETYESWFRAHPKPGDIIFVLKGTPGRVCMVPEPVNFCIAQDMVALRADEKKIYPRYLFAALRSPLVQQRIQQMHVGSLIPHFKKGEFDRLTLPLPSRKVQADIGDFYFYMSSKIECNCREREQLDKLLRTIFSAWFVAFTPVQRQRQGDGDLPEPLRRLFPDDFQGSELGPIPQGWTVQRLSQVLDIEKGVSYKGAFLAADGLPMINLGCFLGNGDFDESKIKSYSGEYRERHLVTAGDILIANTDITQARQVIGSPAIVPKGNGNAKYLFTHHVYAVRFSKQNAFFKQFVYQMLLQNGFRERATGFATGTTVLGLPRDAILGCPFVRPPDALIREFNSIAEPISKRQDELRMESGDLRQIRDKMLSRMIGDGSNMSGVTRLAAAV